jgi:hypothetical protein
VFLCAEHDVDGLGAALAEALVGRQAVSADYVIANHATTHVMARLEAHYHDVISARVHAAAV